ncbi:MAG: paeninodin family lasso peptide [Henriciella sp.]|nr:paeninodin family lasso peptide [Henriciella sp.]
MDVKKEWTTPELTALDVEETLAGVINFNSEGGFLTFTNAQGQTVSGPTRS